MGSNTYSFRIYLLWQALAILLVGTSLVMLLLFGLIETDWLSTGAPLQILTPILFIGTLFAISVLFKKWLTVRVDFIMGINGLEIVLEKPRHFLQRADQLIFWNQIAEWQTEPAHASAHAMSPPEFKLKLADGQKIHFLIADDNPAYRAFLLDFAAQLQVLHQKNPALGRVRRKPEFSQSAAGFWFGGICATLIFLGGTALFFLPLDSKTEMVGNWDMYLGAIALSTFLFLLVWVARRKARKMAEREDG